MTETTNHGLAALESELVRLHAAGAARFDPVRTRCIAAMAERARALPATAAGSLAARARAALQRLQADFQQAAEEAAACLEQLESQQPDCAGMLRQLYHSGEFRALHRRAAALQHDAAPSPGELTRRLAAKTPQPSAPDSLASAMRAQEAAAAGDPSTTGSTAELRSFAPFKEALGALATEQLLAREQRREHADSGPLNPQMLAIRSLESMHALSPQYLNRFVTYLDALFWLDRPAAGYSPPKP